MFLLARLSRARNEFSNSECPKYPKENQTKFTVYTAAGLSWKRGFSFFTNRGHLSEVFKAKQGICSNLRYSWETCIISSNFCNFSQLVLSTHPLLLYQFLSPYQTFVILSNFCLFLIPCYLFTLYVIYVPYKCTCCTHHNHNPHSRLIMRTFLTHQASLAIVPIWYGGSRYGWGFSRSTTCYLQVLHDFVVCKPTDNALPILS